jgi:hypothetical protein
MCPTRKNQGIDPLPIAASLWERTDAVDSAAAELGDHINGHGLTAETVSDALEDAENYAAFEMAVTADYDAQSVVERELVRRLASLLWRPRRATAIENGLFKIQARPLLQFRERRQAHQKRQEIIDGVYRNALATEEDMQHDDETGRSIF